MTTDEAIDAVMLGPFEDSHDGEQLDPPSPEVERAARAFLRELVAARPGVEFDASYDAMEGIYLQVGHESAGVSLSLWNGHVAVLTGPRRSDGVLFNERERGAHRPMPRAAELVPDALRRIDRAE